MNAENKGFKNFVSCDWSVFKRFVKLFQVTNEDISHFGSLLKGDGQILTSDSDDLSSYNIDWLRTVRGIYRITHVSLQTARPQECAVQRDGDNKRNVLLRYFLLWFCFFFLFFPFRQMFCFIIFYCDFGFFFVFSLQAKIFLVYFLLLILFFFVF